MCAVDVCSYLDQKELPAPMCTQEYRRQRRRYKQKQYRRCGDKSNAAIDPIIAEELADPLYQLLVLYAVFCRLTEDLFALPRQSQGVNHRPMRPPHRSKKRDESN